MLLLLLPARVVPCVAEYGRSIRAYATSAGSCQACGACVCDATDRTACSRVALSGEVDTCHATRSIARTCSWPL